MLNPEFAHIFVGRRKREVIFYHSVREKRGVKINTHISFFRKLHPFFKMLGFKLVSVGKFAVLKNRVASVKIEFLFARNKAHCFVNIRRKFVKSARFAGIVSRCLNTARKALFCVKSRNVVALPAVHRHGYVFKRVYCFLRVDTVIFINFSRAVKSVHFLFPLKNTVLHYNNIICAQKNKGRFLC